MRKGLVLFICKDKDQIHSLINKIHKEFEGIPYFMQISSDEGIIEVNGYRLLFRMFSEYIRGYRPEVVYIDRAADISVDDMKDTVECKTFLSTRKIPIRIIDFENEYQYINIKEIIDDTYAMANMIDRDKAACWDSFRCKDKLELKEEYECKWVGDK